MDKHVAAIAIEGMTCGSCVKTIESNVGVIPGVLSIKVELLENEASVVLDPTVVTINDILDKINSMGFVATQKKSPKEKTSEGWHPGETTATRGAGGQQADLTSLFGGMNIDGTPRELGRGKRPPARKPKAAIGGGGGALSEIGVDPSNVKQQGQLPETPEKGKKKKKALNKKPASQGCLDLRPVTESGITVAVFDVETSGLSNTCEIIQLSATSAHGSFNAYILPSTGISSRASQIHEITMVGRNLFHRNTQVPAKKKEEAWRDFIRFCEKIRPVLLVGHNVQFDARFTLNELAKVNLTENFLRVVAGFSDTLPLLRGVLPHLKSHTEEKIVFEVMGPSYTFECHNSEADVAALMDVLQKLRISDEKLIEFSFTTSSLVQRRKNLEEEKNMEVLFSPRRVTRPCLKKLSMAGYTLEELETLGETENQENFINTLLPVLPDRKKAIYLYERLGKLRLP